MFSILPSSGGQKYFKHLPVRYTEIQAFIRNLRRTGGNSNPIGPRACYDEGKRCAETLFFDYHRQYGVAIKVARIFNTYGPRMSPEDGRVVSSFIVQALKGQPLTIFGDGSQSRSFCYVGRSCRSAHTADE